MNRIRLRVAFCCLVLMSVFTVAEAQDVQAVARVDHAKAQIGDPIHLFLSVTYPKGITLQWPALANKLSPFEIIQQSKEKTSTTPSGLKTEAEIVVTTFDKGTFQIPEISFAYSGQGGNGVAKTTAVTIVVEAPVVDVTREIKDVKPPLKVPITWREVLPFVLIALAAILFMGGLIYFIRKRKKGEAILPQAPLRPAHEVALEALRNLEAKRLWQNGRVKEYQSELSDIVRGYLERRYSVLAMEMTTEQIISASSLALLSRDQTDRLRNILELSDLVKFAKLQPIPDENEKAMRLATSFVEVSLKESTAEMAKRMV